MPISNKFKLIALTMIILVSITADTKAQDYNRANAFIPFQMKYFKEPLPAPPTQWFDSKGKMLTIDNFRGKVVILNVWATWCAPCVHEMPSLDKLQRRYKKAGLEVIAVASKQSPSKVNQFFVKKRIRNLNIYVDPTQSVAKGYKVRSLPTTYLISRKGETVAALDGAEDWFSLGARKTIEDELRWQDKPVSAEKTSGTPAL